MKTCFCSSPHSKFLLPLNTSKNGEVFSAYLTTNFDRVAILQVSLMMSFLYLGFARFWTTWMLFLFFWVGINSSLTDQVSQNFFFELISKTHFFGFSFILCFFILSKVSWKSYIISLSDLIFTFNSLTYTSRFLPVWVWKIQSISL